MNIFGSFFFSAVLFFSFSSPSWGKACSFDPASVKVKWTGFKTSKKIGVSGIFTSIKMKGGKGDSPEKALQSAALTIDTQALESGDKARDLKIAKIFFGGMKEGAPISTKVSKIVDGYAYVSVKMNGIGREVPLKIQTSERKITASGFIDIFDFSGASALKAINQACFARHEGKTWNTVDVEFSAECK